MCFNDNYTCCKLSNRNQLRSRRLLTSDSDKLRVWTFYMEILTSECPLLSCEISFFYNLFIELRVPHGASYTYKSVEISHRFLRQREWMVPHYLLHREAHYSYTGESSHPSTYRVVSCSPSSKNDSSGVESVWIKKCYLSLRRRFTSLLLAIHDLLH